MVTEKEAERYVTLREWAEETLPDPGAVFLGEGYSPVDRVGRLEAAYSLWIREHPEDAIDGFEPMRSDEPGLIV